MTLKAGLVTAKNNTDLMREQQNKEQRDFLGTDIQVDKLAAHIHTVWERNRNAKTEIIQRLLYCLRARKGEYSPSELASILSNGGADPVYLKLTGTKCRAASSWIRDIILPAGEKPWSLSPTTEPEIPPELMQEAKKKVFVEVQQMFDEGIMNDPAQVMDFLTKVNENLLKMIKAKAKDSAEKMESRIEDSMDEGHWQEALEDFLEDFVTFPTAFFKGPFYKQVEVLEWGPNFKPEVKKKIKMHWSRISPFDIYPSAYSRDIKKGDLIEKIKLSKEMLYSFMGQEGYSDDAITYILENFSGKDTIEWAWDDFERRVLESGTTNQFNNDTVTGAHFWGSVSGEMLKDWGMEETDTGPIEDIRQYNIDAILVNKKVIRAVINEDPLGSRPYHSACWDSVPGSIWGIGLPEQMEDHQKVVNACARSLCNNMAVASGPQAVVLTDMIAEGEDVTSIFPMKVWQARSSMTGNSGKPVDFFQPDMNAAALMGVLEQFERRADDVTNVPRYSYGNEKIGGAGSTASGLSMLMNSAAKGIRRAISHIDSNVIRPSVNQAFVMLMLDDEDQTIKGDCQVVPRGSTALLIKDQLQVRLQTFLQQTANPIDMQIIGIKGRAALLRESAKLLDLPVANIVPTDEEIDQMQQAQQAAQQAQMQAEQQGEIPSDQAMLPGNQAQIMQNKLQGNPSNVA